MDSFIKRNRFLVYGAPIIVLLVGGSYGLQYFTELRYKYRRNKMLDHDEAKKLGLEMKQGEEKPSLETEYESIKKLNTENWKNIRGPRPWEDSKTVQDAQRKAPAS